MSEVSNPQAEQVAQHPLEAVLEKLEYLVRSLRMELEVAPTDRKAHQDLLRRLIQTSESGLQIPDRAWPIEVYIPEEEPEQLTEEELEMLESPESIIEGEIGEEINVEAINHCLKEHGYQIQLCFPEAPES